MKTTQDTSMPACLLAYFHHFATVSKKCNYFNDHYRVNTNELVFVAVALFSRIIYFHFPIEWVGKWSIRKPKTKNAESIVTVRRIILHCVDMDAGGNNGKNKTSVWKKENRNNQADECDSTNVQITSFIFTCG